MTDAEAEVARWERLLERQWAWLGDAEAAGADTERELSKFRHTLGEYMLAFGVTKGWWSSDGKGAVRQQSGESGYGGAAQGGVVPWGRIDGAVPETRGKDRGAGGVVTAQLQSPELFTVSDQSNGEP